jgi:hypothetical protein
MPSFLIFDNKSPDTGDVTGGYSNDPTPTLEFSLPSGLAAGDKLVVSWNGGTKTVTITAADAAANSINVGIPKLTANGAYTFSASIFDKHQTTDLFDYSSESYTLDTTKPVISGVNVTSDNILTLAEDSTGFTVTGNILGGPSMKDGDAVTVTLTDKTDSFTSTITGHITGAITGAGAGLFSASFTADFGAGAVPLGETGYKAIIDYTNEAGVSSATTTDKFTAVCFMAGTMIRTPQGEQAVETLKAGDLVLTTEGKAAPISWLGRQTVSMIFSDKLRTTPIRLKANALGENVPSRDLLISPDHAVLVDGVLVQAGALVNGESIVREANVPQVFTYYHVELADHSLILAENTPAETFIDNVDRLAFDNWVEHEALYPNGQTIVEMSYPRAKAYRQVPRAIRERLTRRAHALAELAATAA